MIGSTGILSKFQIIERKPEGQGVVVKVADDRIDFVYYWGKKVKVMNSQVVGEPGGLCVNVEVRPNFPSDYRAVMSTFLLEKCR